MSGLLASFEAPALPLHTAGKYVAAAYVVVFAVVLIYVAIMAVRLKRMQRDLGELLAEQRSGQHSGEREVPDRESTAV